MDAMDAKVGGLGPLWCVRNLVLDLVRASFQNPAQTGVKDPFWAGFQF